MIAGGETYEEIYDEMTEVVELSGTITNSTPSFGTLPSKPFWAVGAMLDNTPILCGGTNGYGNYFDSCTSFQNSQWNQSHSMNAKRSSAAGVQINSTTIWILGGDSRESESSYVFHNSTEFILQGQTNGVPGPELPYGLSKMCAVNLSAQEIFVIGGSTDPEESNNLEYQIRVHIE